MSAAPGTISISIIVPAYNAQDYIAASLVCILRQMQPWHELIVIDDGSADATLARAQAACAAWPHCVVRWHRQANSGIADTRNRGVALAQGDYLLFVDSDDLLQPDALAGLDGVIASEAPDVIATGFRIWHPDREAKSHDLRLSYPAGVRVEGTDAILAPYFADRHMYIWCKIVRRSVYAALGLPLFPSGRLFEDMAVVPRLLLACRSLVYLPQVLLHYRQHPVSITRVITPRWCTDFVRALDTVKPHFAQAGVSAAVRAQFDAAACHFYLCAVKTSYELPAAQGAAVRAEVKAIFLASLFGTAAQALASMEDGSLLSANRKGDLRCARQVRQALANRLRFHLSQTLNRKVKRWQRQAQLRALRGAQPGLASPQ